MSTPVVTLNKVESVRNIVMILQNETHYGFPIVDTTNCCHEPNANGNSDSINNLDFGIQEEEIDGLSVDYAVLKDEITISQTDNYINKMKIKRALGDYGEFYFIIIICSFKMIFSSY